MNNNELSISELRTWLEVNKLEMKLRAKNGQCFVIIKETEHGNFTTANHHDLVTAIRLAQANFR